ncbi:MAG: DPP IV N-terminal domain-containing protein, partial [Acidobacteriota bacterium]|nr:DPP IV N-terminal domain-containing protein [Acidobacteriota bacterium]
MKKTFRFLPFYFYLFTSAYCLSAVSQTLTVREIMREPSIAGMRPESEKLSPDGKLVVFAWNADAKEPRNLYLISSSGGQAQMIVAAEKNYEARTPASESKLNYGLIVHDDFVKAREKNLGGAEFSPDSKRLLFTQNTDIYVLEIESQTNVVSIPRRITRTQGAEFAARWLDDQTILYQSSGNFFSLNIEKTALVQLSKEANPTAFINVSFATPTDDSKLLAYAVSDSSKQRALFVPNYLDEFVQSPTFRRGFTEQNVKIVKTDGSLEKPIDVNLPKVEGASYLRNLQWLADGKRLVIDRLDQDTKRRQIFIAQIIENKTEVFLIDEEIDRKWIGSLSRTIEPNPKNSNQFFFTSERDGWNHIYLATIDANKFKDGRANADIKQLTRGVWETSWARWSADGAKIIYSSTEENSATREFYALNVSNSGKQEIPSSQDGMRTEAQLATKEDILLYKFSRWNEPTELYAQKICSDCRGLNSPQKLTESIPEKFKQIKWSKPQFFSIKAKDGKQIPAKIYLPSNFDKSKKYPMIIFVHGAGYLQNVINGWNNYYREFMFHTLLTQKGYVVLDIDYRGSAGYGRDFRTDVYDFLGGLDYEDHLDAIDFAVKKYAVDEKRIGVYGGSYGGFMAEMLVMRAPEKIAAAAALRPVGDWKNYFYSSPIYTTER